MKTQLRILLLIFFCLSIESNYAQAPQAIPYQAVARDNAGNLLANQNISLRFGIFPVPAGGTLIYQETHSVTTNAFGFFTVNVGQGTITSGTFSAINWGSGDKFLQVEMDAAGGSNYIDMGRTQMLSVPYALYAGNSSSSGWSLTGNAGTVAGTNFIGTTDNVPLSFRVNNQKAGRIDNVLENTFFGYQSGNSNTGGALNTANGFQTLYYNSSGNSNTANGFQALFFNSTGSDNTANGYGALQSNTFGNNNTANGLHALFSNTTGGSNAAHGTEALYSNTIGNNNAASGVGALYFNVAGNNGVAMGYSSQFFTNNQTTNWDNTNTSLGYQSLMGSATPANNTGTANIAIGRDALYSNTTGSYNAANGYQALYYNTTGIRNTANGYQALYNNSTGGHNTAYGFNTLYQTTVSSYNTALGISAGAIFDNGSFNTFIGTNAYANGAGYINSTCLGSNTTMTASNQVRIGNGNITSIGGQVGWSTVSDARFKKNVREDVHGLDFIMQLKPVTYNLDLTGINNFIGKDKAIKEHEHAAGEKESTEDLQATAAKEKIVYSGFLAQDVEASAKKLGYNFSGVDAPKNEKDYYGLRYAEFVIPLVKAVQEQQEQIEKLIAENQKLKTENISFKTDIEKIKLQLGMEIKAEK